MGALPPYTYVPGLTPHPVSDPRGHAFGHSPPLVEPLDPFHPETSSTWCEARLLFNAGYYWEAHEAWESLWHAAGRTGPVADFLKGLIKWAAAGVKVREGRPEGVRRHCLRAAELLRSSMSVAGSVPIAGIEVSRLLAVIDSAVQIRPSVSGTSTDVRPIPEWTVP